MKVCCVNCKYLDHDFYYCDGMRDPENECCPDFVESFSVIPPETEK